MMSRFRPRFTLLSVLVLSVSISSSGRAVEGVSPLYPEHWLDDADLHGLFFLDSKAGWACGDLGVIVQTSDGGGTWRRQPTPIGASLVSIHFVDLQHGWAVGGMSFPGTQRSIGIVLQTSDGGATWTKIPGLLLPRLRHVHFLTTNRGYAVGDVTSTQPNGLFVTHDGGRTWSPLQGMSGESWDAGAFTARGVDDVSGILTSRNGGLAWIHNQEARLLSPMTKLDWLHSAAISTIIDPQIAFAGMGTEPRLTLDEGRNWLQIQPLPQTISAQFRWKALAAHGSFVWLAGDPGTQVLRSDDHARTWQAVKTGRALPIHRLHFVDQRRGWGVGSWGSIFGTQDGGLTWEVQRSGGKRAALLVIVPEERDIPWELITQSSALGEYRTHIVLLMSQDQPFKTSTSERLRDAATRVGATGEVLTRLQTPSYARDLGAAEILETWQAQAADPATDLTNTLARTIRTWSPEVIVTTSFAPAGSEPRGIQKLVRQIVKDASELAASETAFPEQAEGTGLLPWTTKRILTLQHQVPTATNGRVREIYVPSLGRSVRDLATTSSRWMSSPDVTPDQWTLVPIQQEEGRPIGTNPLGGLAVNFDTACRRPRGRAAESAPIERRAIQRMAQLRGILSTLHDGHGLKPGMFEQSDQLLQELAPELASELLFEIAVDLQTQGDLDGAEQLYRKLILRYGNQPLSDAALQWLMSYHGSAELQWRRQKIRPGNTSEDGVALATMVLQQSEQRGKEEFADVTSSDLPGNPSSAPSLPQVHSEQATATSTSPWKPALDLAAAIRTARPDLFGEPEVVFPLAAIERGEGHVAQAVVHYRRQLALPNPTWRQYAAQELRILDPTTASSGHRPRGKSSSADGSSADGSPANGGTPADGSLGDGSIWRCQAISAKPYLDGDLSDPCWTSVQYQSLLPWGSTTIDGALVGSVGEERLEDRPDVQPGEIESGVGAPSRVYLLHDDEYLYLGAICRRQSDVTYLPARFPRPRDSDLRDLDRIVLDIDTNRDYVTSWHFEIDHRGWTAESVWGDLRWNPNYHVAAAQTESTWTIEVAIPLAELTAMNSESAKLPSVWGVRVQRMVPHHPIQSWNPSSIRSLSAATFGLLTFER